MSKWVEQHLLEKIKGDKTIHMTLLDPEKTRFDDCANIAEEAEKAGTSAIMIGGSTLASNEMLDEVVKAVSDKVSVPTILFPNNISGVSKYADAIWFMSLLNSSSTYYLIDAQALTAYTVKKLGLEVLPMGYIIVGPGGAAGYIGQARPIPLNHPELALGYSLAGESLGMRFIYLEAGSGAKDPVPPKMIRLVKNQLSVPLIVGGGIRDNVSAKAAAQSGADIIVTGTIVEKTDKVRDRIQGIIKTIKNLRRG